MCILNLIDGEIRGEHSFAPGSQIRLLTAFEPFALLFAFLSWYNEPAESERQQPKQGERKVCTA